jgi:penicillin-binding protein 1A
VDLLSLTFNIEGIRFAGSKQQARALDYYLETINPLIDVSASVFGIDDMKYASRVGYAKSSKRSKKNLVEGALLSMDTRTGHILAMVGGRKFESTNQFNRAVQSKVQPGSAFKPLYYSAAISAHKVTPATMLVDAPVVFWNDDNTPYIPLNFKGEWKGRVLLRDALAHSMNVPSLKVLDTIGFDAAITRASKLLGVTDPFEIESTFPRKYPLGLGVITVSPLGMARAFATFGNQGRAVEPLAIRYVEDRNGKLILEPEKDLRSEQMRAGRSQQILTPQEAYIMVSLLQSTVSSGTLRWASSSVGGFDRPIAGKTGTTQNWSDAWTVGFTPQITTAVWFGFDERGYSLGINQTGATSAGPAWAEYMKRALGNLPAADFVRPTSGLLEVTVCAKSGMLPTKYCNQGTVREIFLTGTEPRDFCDLHRYEFERDTALRENLKGALLLGDAIPQDFPVPDLGSENLFSFEEIPGYEESSEDSTSPDVNPLLD